MWCRLLQGAVVWVAVKQGDRDPRYKHHQLPSAHDCHGGTQASWQLGCPTWMGTALEEFAAPEPKSTTLS